jgi:serine/threonine protein kinase
MLCIIRIIVRWAFSDRVQEGGETYPQQASQLVVAGHEGGAVVAGRYRVVRTLDEAGAGLVVEATDLGRNGRVVLKFLSHVTSIPPETAAAFLREANLVARLRSEHIARVFDAGVTDEGALYLAREYVVGQSIARALRMHGPFPVARATEYVIQACAGLAEAHSRGIIHGDIKPYNLYLAEVPGTPGALDRSQSLGSVRIVDFGTSNFAFAYGSNIVTSMIIGYMPPERLRAGATVDHRSDIWSLGATLYELLTGEAAFDTSQTLGRLVTAILDEPAPCPHRARPEVPEDLADIVKRCLAKNDAERFQSVRDLATALLPFASPSARSVAERAGWVRAAVAASSAPVEAEPELLDTHRDPARGANSPSLAPVSKTLPAVDARVALRSLGDATHAPDAEFEAEDEAPPPEAPPPEVPPYELPLYTVPRWLAAAIVSVAGAFVFLAILLSANERGSDTFGSGAALAAQAQVVALPVRTENPTPGPLPAAPEIFQLVVRASPESAQIAIDGTVVEGNPFRALYPKGDEAHRVTATAEGYESKSADVVLATDVTLDLDLSKSH